MVVADDEIDATLVGVFDALDGLDAAIECDDQLETVFGSIVDALEGDSITFFVAVGNVELDFLLLEERLQIAVTTATAVVPSTS